MVSDWNCLKYFCLFLYCNHQVHEDFSITLYIYIYTRTSYKTFGVSNWYSNWDTEFASLWSLCFVPPSHPGYEPVLGLCGHHTAFHGKLWKSTLLAVAPPDVRISAAGINMRFVSEVTPVLRLALLVTNHYSGVPLRLSVPPEADHVSFCPCLRHQ
jgi:hypothetical protein